MEDDGDSGASYGKGFVSCMFFCHAAMEVNVWKYVCLCKMLSETFNYLLSVALFKALCEAVVK